MSLARRDVVFLGALGVLVAGVVTILSVVGGPSSRALGQEQGVILESVPEGYLAFTIDIEAAYNDALAGLMPEEPPVEFPFEISDEHVLTGDPALVLDGFRDDARHSNIQVAPEVHVSFDYIPGSGWGSMTGEYPAAYNSDGVPLDVGTRTNQEGTTASVVLGLHPATLEDVLIVLGPPSADEPCRVDRRLLSQPC